MAQASYRTRMLEAFRKRMYAFIVAAALIFVILIIQLIYLQIVRGEEYAAKARANMENYIAIPASRGEMYDRNFQPGVNKTLIVSNRPSFNLTTVPASFESKKKLRETLLTLSRLTPFDYRQVMADIEQRNPWERIIIKEDVSFDSIVKVASFQNRFPNIDWEDAPLRVYNYGNMFAHSLGYIGSISRDEYLRRRSTGYRHYQKIGKNGMEREYDRNLRGKDGYVVRIVDVRNRTEGEEMGLPPEPGNNMVLTLDYQIQKTAYDAMEERKGAVVVLKPATGEVLALVSKPDFDPNLLVARTSREIIEELSTDKNRPFLNRAIQSKYPPASTFKLITAIAGLETEKTFPGKTYHCSGKYTLKGYRDHDFYCYRVHGTLNLYQAIAESCSVYFYQLGYAIGPTSILKYARHFGLDERTGIDIPGEIDGFIPTKRWKLKTFGQPWFDGDTINLSIGQGFLGVTPLGMANFIAGIVNNGLMFKPRMVRQILSPDNRKVLESFESDTLREIPLSPLTLKTIKEGMRMSVTTGTSIRLSGLTVPVAGKTGTAQTRSERLDKKTQHAWFVGFGPYGGTPEDSVVIAVIVEFGIAGAATAVPVAERVFARLIELGYLK